MPNRKELNRFVEETLSISPKQRKRIERYGAKLAALAELCAEHEVDKVPPISTGQLEKMIALLLSSYAVANNQNINLQGMFMFCLAKTLIKLNEDNDDVAVSVTIDQILGGDESME